MKLMHRRPYTQARAMEYPPVKEQLDAIWKYLATVEGLPEETQAMLERVNAVKKRHPKGA